MIATILPIQIVLFLAIAFLVLCFLLVVLPLMTLWIQAQVSGAPISFLNLIGMRLRKVNARVIVLNLIRARQAGIDLSSTQLESHYLSGGHVPDVVTAMIVARAANMDVDWETLAAADLRGENVADFVDAALKSGAAPSLAPTSLPEAAPADDGTGFDPSELIGAVSASETYIPLPGRVSIDGQPAVAVAEQAPIERGAQVEVVDVVVHLVVRQKAD